MIGNMNPETLRDIARRSYAEADRLDAQAAALRDVAAAARAIGRGTEAMAAALESVPSPDWLLGSADDD